MPEIVNIELNIPLLQRNARGALLEQMSIIKRAVMNTARYDAQNFEFLMRLGTRFPNDYVMKEGYFMTDF